MNKEDEEKLFDSIESNSQIDSILTYNWVKNLTYISNILYEADVNDSNLLPFENLFWIRLWSIIVELPQNFRKTFELFEVKTEDEFSAKYGDDPEFKIAVYPFRISDLILEMKSVLLEEELIAIDNFRHTNCHLVQKGYQLWFKGVDDKKLKDCYTPKTIGVSYAIEKLNEILSSYTHKHSGNMLSQAVSINRKVRSYILDLDSLYAEIN